MIPKKTSPPPLPEAGRGGGEVLPPTDLVEHCRACHNGSMNTTLPRAWEEPMPDTSEFAGLPLYADVVFDRPIDHAFTYAVPDALRVAIGVGRRVQAPFGRGDRSTIGFCVRVH